MSTAVAARRGWRRWLTNAVMPVAILLGSAMVWSTSQAAFTASTSTGMNSWSTGSVAITNSQAGSAVFTSLSNLQPDNSLTALNPPTSGQYAASLASNGGSGCIKVTYTGSSPVNIRMYATRTDTPSGSGLAQFLLFSVDIGTGATDVNCTGFASTSYIYGPNSNSSTYMNAFPSNYASASSTEWTNVTSGSSQWYRLSWLLPKGSSNSSQSQRSDVIFSWEAQGQ